MGRKRSSYYSKSSDDSDLDEDFYGNREEKRRKKREKAKRKLEETEEKLAKLKRRRIETSKIPKFKPVRLQDENGRPFVKNFCVGVTRLDDEFVKSALLGELYWNLVFEQDDNETRKQRNRLSFQSKFVPGYLFEREGDQEDVKRPVDRPLQLAGNDRLPNKSFLAASKLQRESSAAFGSFRSLATEPETSSVDSRLTGRSSSLLSSARSTASLDCRSKDYDLLQDLKLNNLNRILTMLKSLESDLESSESGSPVGESVKCPDCSYTTTSIQNLFLHSSYHRNQCSSCKQSKFSSVYSYYRHMGMHLKKSQTDCSLKLDYRCNACQVHFRQSARLLEHFNSYHALVDQQLQYGEQTIRFKCKICDLVDVSHRSLQDHYVQSHAQLKCSLCTRWFHSLEQLEQHALLDHKPFAHNYECCFCGQKFTFRTAFEEHLAYKHGVVIGDDKRGSCFLCAHPFDEDKERVLGHLAGHCGIYLYNCDTCEFRLVLCSSQFPNQIQQLSH